MMKQLMEGIDQFAGNLNLEIFFFSFLICTICNHIPVDDVRFIRCAPSFGAAGLFPLPPPADNGLARVVGAGAAMAAQGSSSSIVVLAFTFNDFEPVLGAGAAMEPHRLSSSLAGLGVLLEPELESE